MGTLLRLGRDYLIWSTIFAIAGLFQVYRGAPLDGVFFLIAIVAMRVSLRTDFTSLHTANPRYIKLYFSLVTIGLITSKIHTVPGLFCILLFLPLLPFALTNRSAPTQLTTPLVRSIGVWTALGVAVAFYEMMSYIIGAVTDRPYHYPTISMLVDPALHNFFGRALFVLCWSWIGYRFIFKKQVR